MKSIFYLILLVSTTLFSQQFIKHKVVSGESVYSIAKKHKVTENEIFGELSLLDSDTRSASATTLSDCTLLKIEQEAFYDLVATNTDILKGIMRTLCKRLREQDRITVEMKKSKAKENLSVEP